ncbi:hypothetical protein [Rhodococcus sp. O3]|uniref:hypothetical protein n=1 Tax=Rhodococcus sp. O3 TaxID=3404919 RepID=UPI003B680611
MFDDRSRIGRIADVWESRGSAGGRSRFDVALALPLPLPPQQLGVGFGERQETPVGCYPDRHAALDVCDETFQ